MKITQEQMTELRKHIPSFVPDSAIEAVAGMFPDNMAPKHVLAVMTEQLADVREGMSESQIVKKVQSQFAAMRKAQSQDNPANSKQITRDYYDSLLVEMRLMGTQEPTTKTSLFGCEMDSPVMTAALSHLGTFNPDAESPMEKYAQAAAMTNVLHWVGMCENDEYQRLLDTGARCVRIVKPYADEDKVYSQLRYAAEHGSVAVGMDIDHTFTAVGGIDVVMGEPMEVKSLEKMRAYVQATELPFVVKGILSVRDAVLCREIGASGIVVSHHGGRIGYAVPPASIVPEIRKAVGKDMAIIVDCGITSGYDAYKALALGADAVGVGTHLIPYVTKDSAEACADRMRAITAELKGVMAYTGVENCRAFDPEVLHRR